MTEMYRNAGMRLGSYATTSMASVYRRQGEMVAITRLDEQIQNLAKEPQNRTFNADTVVDEQEASNEQTGKNA
jgi:hypothetical protein